MKYLDYNLVIVVIFLIGFGLVMLYSASSYSAGMKFDGDNMHFLKRQLFFSVVGLGGMWFVSRINYHYYAKIAFALYLLSFFLMALVKFSPLGVSAYGAKRWIRLPFGQQMQPAEVTKIAVILLIPFLICQAGKKVNKWTKQFVIFLWGVAAAAGVFYLTDNLSTAIIVLGITYVLLFVAHPKIVIPSIVTVALGVFGYTAARMWGNSLVESNSFRVRRILVWVKPEQYLDEGGLQVMQGLYAIGSGGFFGKGLGKSVQKRIIPEVQNDMILSVICEELGVFGAIVVFVLFGMLLYRLMFIARNAKDVYGSLIVTGIFAHIAIQVTLNIAVVLNLIPTTGITLPFISYGGTSLLFLMAEIGIALGVSRHLRIDE